MEQALVSTAVQDMPTSTVTVEQTILMTTFVTFHLTTVSADIPTSVTSSTSYSSTSETSLGSSVAVSTNPISVPSSSRHATLPVVVAQSSSATLQPTTTPVQTTVASSTATAETSSVPAVTTDALTQRRVHQRHAIVGGLAGAIGVLILLGLLLCFCLRRRKKQRDQDETASVVNEKGLRPAMVRQWTALTGKGTPKSTPRITQISSPVTVDEDHHIIRMNLNHWARPFANGQGEGFRDSVAPGVLRVVNADESRPVTPRPATQRSDTAGSFLRKQRTALTSVLLSANRSRANSKTNVLPSATPEITIDPKLSLECVMAPTPSFKQYVSVVTLPVIVQHPPEDPFVTPPLETTADQRAKRPGLAPLQSAAGAAGRTLSHLGSFLNPFKARSDTAESERTFSRHSVSTFASRSSWRGTALSDPWDLDRPSERGSAVPYRSANEMEQSHTPPQKPYAGT